MAFGLANDEDRVDVVYEGIPPDEFGSGTDLLVDGTYDLDGVLQARYIREPGTLCTVCH